MTAQMMADDGFGGAGGWDLAAEALGIHARGIENMKEARLTRDAAGLTTIHDDVWTFVPDGRAIGKIDSPPCPTFSAAGKGSGRKALDSVYAAIRDGAYRDLDHLKHYPVSDDDDRTRLVLTPLHFATGYEYEWLAWEQVKAVLPVWELCAEVLREQGWHVWTGLVHSEQYGVPQTRTRAKLLASRLGPVSAPVPTHSRYYPRDPKRLDDGVAKWISMAEGIGWGLLQRPSYTIMAGGGDRSTNGQEWGSAGVRASMFAAQDDPDRWVVRTGNFTARDHRGQRGVQYERSINAPAPTVTGTSSRWELTSRRDSPGWIEEHGSRQNRRTDQPAPTLTGEAHRWAWTPTPAIEGETAADVDWAGDCPSPTIVGSFHPDVVAKRGYRKAGDPPRQKTPGSIRINIAEAAILQSFPADYPFQGTQTKKFLQVGNAVPPLMAYHSLSAAAVHHLERQEGVA